MSEMNTAYRLGWVAGYGTAVVREQGPYGDLRIPWTNYVPAWIDDADNVNRPGWNGKRRHQAEWKRGFDHGKNSAAEHSYHQAITA